MRWFLNSYSNDIEKEIMSHFDACIPLAKQPRYIGFCRINRALARENDVIVFYAAN